MKGYIRESAWPHIDPGKKHHRIEIQGEGTGTEQDAYGQPNGTWTAVFSGFAAIETISAREQFQGGFVSQVFYSISIDWVPTPIKANMRVVVHPIRGANASVYLIQAIENVQRRDLVLCLTCIEIDAEKVGS